MKTSTKAVIGTLIGSALLALIFPVWGGLTLLCAFVLFIKVGVNLFYDRPNRASWQYDHQQMKTAGGSDADALMYAAMRKENRRLEYGGW